MTSIRSARSRSPQVTSAMLARCRCRATDFGRGSPAPGNPVSALQPRVPVTGTSTRTRVTRIRAPRRGTLVMLRTWGSSAPTAVDVVRREHLAQHRHALHQREAGADAAADAAAERDPGVGRRVAGRGTARGRTRSGSGWLSLAAVGDAGSTGRRWRRAGRSMPPMVAGRHQGPHHHRDHRVQPHRLLEHRLEPVVVAASPRRPRWARRSCSGSRPSS